MPKGQYTRKPRTAEPEAEPTVLVRREVEGGVRFVETPESAWQREERELAQAAALQPSMMEQPLVMPLDEPASPEAKAEAAVERTEDHLRAAMQENAEVREAIHAKAAEPARETYDDWMDEDERPTINNPADSIVHSKVGQWAGSICTGWHQVVWMPADNGEAIEVTLTTDHGVTILKKPAGNWTEADVDAALAQMRSDLRV